MRRYAILFLVAGVVGALITAAVTLGGTRTAKRPYLVPTPEGQALGVITDPILSTGDLVGQYQMSGIPDGLGASSGDDQEGDHQGAGGETFNVLMNHELGRSFPGQPPAVDARISKLTIDRATRSVESATYFFTGQEGFERFCSATLRKVNGTPYYLTGEEAINAGHDGSSIVMNADTGQWWETPHFGHIQHENVVPLRLSQWVFLTSEDDFRTAPRTSSYLYAYIAPSFHGAVAGTQGSLYVWRADDPAKAGNANVVKGESVPGHFVPIPQSENTSNVTLKAAAENPSRRAFKFDRLEDITVHGGRQDRVYFADTGKPPVTAKGRIYQLDFSRSDPTQATLKMIINGDAPDNESIFNPDNLDASNRMLVIQEDRESPYRDDWNYVLTYDFTTGALTRVARVDTTPPLRKGQWESSGVISARHLLGRDWWLLDVQAHNQLERQPGTSAPGVQPAPWFGAPNGEDGQMLAIKIPGSQGGGGDH